MPPADQQAHRARLSTIADQLTAARPAAEPGTVVAAAGGLRAGIIGLDTSHSIAFTKVLNADSPAPEFASCRIVAAVARGTGATTWPVTPTIKSSAVRIPGYTKTVEELGVKVVPTVRSPRPDRWNSPATLSAARAGSTSCLRRSPQYFATHVAATLGYTRTSQVAEMLEMVDVVFLETNDG